MKFADAGVREKVRLAETPAKAKKMGKSGFSFRNDWEQVKDGVMLKTLRAKFTQHANLIQAIAS